MQFVKRLLNVSAIVMQPTSPLIDTVVNEALGRFVTATSQSPVSRDQRRRTSCRGIYRVAREKRPELCVTLTARILYGVKFPLARL